MSDVLIIGAGPAGLTMAYELIKRGIEVRIIDQAVHPSIYSKALGLQAKTLECFEKMDLIDQFLKQGLPLRQIQFHFQEKNFTFNITHSQDVPYPFILIVPQSTTEKILNNAIEVLGKKVERGVGLKNFLPDEHAILQHPDGNEEIVYPKWIIACDGAHSTVRNVLNIPFKGNCFQETFVLADVELTTAFSHDQMNTFFGDRGVCAIIPLPSSNQFRIILPFRKELHLEKSMIDADFIQRAINDRIVGINVKIKTCHWLSLFYIHRHIVPHFRYRNIFLVGDAAHVHSPAGGQGLNTSVQDAQNLAWKLALVIQGSGRTVLLDSYEKERMPVAMRVLNETTKITQKINFFQKHSSGIFFHLLNFLSSKKSFLKKISLALSELNIYYSESPIICRTFIDYFWDGPDPGERAPDVTYANKRRLFSHFKDHRHILLFFEDDRLSYFPEKMKAQHENLIKVITVAKEHSGLDVIHDEENKIHKIYNAIPGSLYLIRPDGFIACRQRKLNERKFNRYLRKIFKS